MSSYQEEEAIDRTYDARLMRRLLSYLRPYRVNVLAAMGLIAVASVLQVSSPYLTKIGIDNYIVKKDLAGLNKIVLIYLAIIVFGFFLGYIQTYLMQLTGQKIMYDLRVQIFSHLQDLPLAFYDRNPVGRLMTRVTTDVDVLNELFTSGVVTLLGDVLVLFGILVIIFWLNVKLALVAMSVIPIIALITVVFKIKARDSYRRVRTAIARINAFLQEHLTGMTVVQLFHHEQSSFQQFEGINRLHLDANMDSVLAYSLFYPAVEIVSAVAVALIIWYGGGQVLHRELSFGALVAFIQYSEKFFRPIADLSEKYNILQAAMASSERIFKLLDVPVDIKQPNQPIYLKQIKGEIEFRNVSFGYPGAASATLSNLSFHIMPGETIAIVGKNGAGKSTLVKLIARFYDPDIGNVLYDGIDLREISLDFLYRHTAFVFQGFAAYEASVADNIAYGDHNRLLNNRREVERIAQYTGADKLIKKMPHGYETLLGRVFGEYDLSTGQWQQIAIARAFARQNANLLILDEPTASLDVQAEYELFERFRTLARGKTTILVSHRFSTVALADRILVLEEGRLVEQGTHSELLGRGGHYASLYEIQGRARKSLRENSTGAV